MPKDRAEAMQEYVDKVCAERGLHVTTNLAKLGAEITAAQRDSFTALTELWRDALLHRPQDKTPWPQDAEGKYFAPHVLSRQDGTTVGHSYPPQNWMPLVAAAMPRMRALSAVIEFFDGGFGGTDLVNKLDGVGGKKRLTRDMRILKIGQLRSRFDYWKTKARRDRPRDVEYHEHLERHIEVIEDRLSRYEATLGDRRSNRRAYDQAVKGIKDFPLSKVRDSLIEEHNLIEWDLAGVTKAGREETRLMREWRQVREVWQETSKMFGMPTWATPESVSEAVRASINPRAVRVAEPMLVRGFSLPSPAPAPI